MLWGLVPGPFPQEAGRPEAWGGTRFSPCVVRRKHTSMALISAEVAAVTQAGGDGLAPGVLSWLGCGALRPGLSEGASEEADVFSGGILQCASLLASVCCVGG